MSVYRPRIIASLCLMLAVGAVAAVMILLRPEPADAAGNRERQFTFGPVYVAAGQIVDFLQTNTGTRPTPPATVVFSDPFNGLVFDTTRLPSLPPGEGNGRGPDPGPARYTRVVVTFDRPAAGQEIPSPFPGTVVILDGNPTKVETVLYPAR